MRVGQDQGIRKAVPEHIPVDDGHFPRTRDEEVNIGRWRATGRQGTAVFFSHFFAVRLDADSGEWRDRPVNDKNSTRLMNRPDDAFQPQSSNRFAAQLKNDTLEMGPSNCNRSNTSSCGSSTKSKSNRCGKEEEKER